ncbi:MAG TPA: M28 family peptidase [Blastocatellia bacterium]|nr:M28 family peptidase [Blastocatellia bacterium]
MKKMKKAGLLAVITATLIGLTAPAPAPVSAARRAYGETLQKPSRGALVSEERIRKHVEFLASDKLEGRRAGTPAEAEAAKYIAKEFRSYGLEPVAKNFLQPFTFVSSVKLGAKNSFQMKTPAGARTLKVGEEFMPLAFSSSDPAAGQVVLAGYGISAPEHQYDNYANLDARGKILLIMRGSPDGDNPHGRFAEHTAPGLEIQQKTLKAREKGARGVVFISAEQDFKQDRLSKLRHDLNFLNAAIPAVVITRQVAESLLAPAGTTLAEAEKRAKQSAAPLALENASIEFKTDVVQVNGNSANVVGLLKGSDARLASEYIVIGAHYDHLGLGGAGSLAEREEGEIHHGADDNASGTSAMLELARVLAADRSQLKRSILFMAFGAEEVGLLGSAAYTKNPVVPLASTVAMINMDMVGRLRNTLSIGGVGTSPAWKPLIEKHNLERFNLSLGQDGFGPSDHQSFYVRDIPVLFFFTGSHDDYHKPSDTADKINAEGIRKIAEFVGELATAVATEPERIAFTRVKVESRPTGRGFRVYLGTVPNYSDQSDGMKLDGVRPGSPAERAGLKAGDLIVKLGSVPIKNVYDYTYALGELKAGEEIAVQIRREGREMTLKLTPDKRQ